LGVSCWHVELLLTSCRAQQHTSAGGNHPGNVYDDRHQTTTVHHQTTGILTTRQQPLCCRTSGNHTAFCQHFTTQSFLSAWHLGNPGAHLCMCRPPFSRASVCIVWQHWLRWSRPTGLVRVAAGGCGCRRRLWLHYAVNAVNMASSQHVISQSSLPSQSSWHQGNLGAHRCMCRPPPPAPPVPVPCGSTGCVGAGRPDR
jgi:hypothetical protein